MSLSDDDLKRLAPFTYDEWMLRETKRAVGFTRGIVDHNANLESFALHARAVFQFFFPRGENGRGRTPHSDDIHVESFVDGPWEEVSGFGRGDLETMHSRVGKEIAHITEARAKRTRDFGLSEPWNVSDIHDELQKHAARFADLTGWEPLPLIQRHAERDAVTATTLAPGQLVAYSDKAVSTSSPTSYTDVRSLVPGDALQSPRRR